MVEESRNAEIPIIFWVQDIYSEAIKKVFGLDKPRPKFADFKMSEEDHALEEYEAEKRKLFDGLEEDALTLAICLGLVVILFFAVIVSLTVYICKNKVRNIAGAKK